MKFLKTMTGSLPESARDNFMQSDARISMEYIIDTLEGRQGLIRDIEQRKAASASGVGASQNQAAPAAPEPPVQPVPASQPAAAPAAPPLGRMAALRAAPSAGTGKPKKRHSIAEMLAFLGKLAGALPDPHLGTAINRKVETVISEIKPAGKDTGKPVPPGGKNGDVHE
jgi:hypothetical protein